MTDIESYFCPTYQEARDRFLSACQNAPGVTATSYLHPMKGIAGEDLYLDAAFRGAKSAENIIVVTSGTHGVEGYGGSGIQIACLAGEGQLKIPEGTAIVYVHGVNPYGFSWNRRVNEDNIDLNRNFVDHSGGQYPENDLFPELYPYAVPNSWDSASISSCDQQLAELKEKYGDVAVRKSLTKGQYQYPDSVHYGGNAPAWSNRTLYTVCDELLKTARRAVLIDLHTGLGPYGYGELMTPSKPGDPDFDRLSEWLGGEVHSTTAGSSAYAGSKGSILAGFRPNNTRLEWTPVGLEFGTLDWATVTHAMRADIWLYVHGKPTSSRGDQIRRQVKDAFFIDEEKWKSMICRRGIDVIQRVANALA